MSDQSRTVPLTIENPAYFARLAEVEEAHWWSLGMWRLASHWLDAALGDRRGLRALDVGCGTGLTARRLAERRGVIEVVGLDPSPEALELARTRHGFPLVLGSALDLPFVDGRFDLVTCFDVIQHLSPSSVERATRELRRVLAPGGVVVVRSNGRGWSGDESTYTPGRLGRLIESAGLSLRRVSYANGLPALAQEIRGGLTRRLPLPGAARALSGHPSGGGLRIAVPGTGRNRIMGGVSRVEAWVAGRLGVPLPFGHSTLALGVRPRPG